MVFLTDKNPRDHAPFSKETQINRYNLIKLQKRD
jgi:hypothetical protein